MQNDFYFSEFENRKPPPPTPHDPAIEFWWQLFATATIALGFWYLYWRWTESLNSAALVFSTLVAAAETLAFIGLLLFFHNLWRIADTPWQTAPRLRNECLPDNDVGPISVDLFIATHTENPEIVRLSMQDAKKITVPNNLRLNLYLLDDGNRLAMLKTARQEGITYLSRADNRGFKAGNLKNALEKSTGDFVIICDADTRLFPGFLVNTLGYFRDPDVAWVQTPQWFYDIPTGRSLIDVLGSKFGAAGRQAGRAITALIGPVQIGKDPFCSDPGLFFDVIQRRRNRANGSFCCGAASIHRREAIYEVALCAFGTDIDRKKSSFSSGSCKFDDTEYLDDAVSQQVTRRTELTPYRFHVSEDFYTSIFLHSHQGRNWKSVYHTEIESKMLSPWSLQSWAIQNFKYAGGTLDILINDNPILTRRMSLQKRLFYSATFWSYLSPIWVLVLLWAPVITMATGLAPVQSYSSDFYLHLLPFLLLHEIATVLGTWGHNPMRGKLLSVTSFAIVLQALKAVLSHRQIKFPATPKEQIGGRYLGIVRFHIGMIAVTVLAFALAVARNFNGPDPDALAALIVNGFWGLNNILALGLLVSAAFWTPPTPASLAPNCPV